LSQPLPARVRRNVILVIADGQQVEDELAISRCLYGRDHGLLANRFPDQGNVAIWDVSRKSKLVSVTDYVTLQTSTECVFVERTTGQNGSSTTLAGAQAAVTADKKRTTHQAV
jgi:hypothetical protein